MLYIIEGTLKAIFQSGKLSSGPYRVEKFLLSVCWEHILKQKKPKFLSHKGPRLILLTKDMPTTFDAKLLKDAATLLLDYVR